MPVNISPEILGFSIYPLLPHCPPPFPPLNPSALRLPDMKPANVLLKSSNNDPRGFTVKVSDFGLSRCVEEEEHCEATPMQFAMHSHVPHIQWDWTPVPSELTKALLLSPQCLLGHIQNLKCQYLIPCRPPVCM